jgi:two-component system, cell cycle response regulator CtrA
MMNVFLYEPRDERRVDIITELLSVQMVPVEITDGFFRGTLSALNNSKATLQPFLMASAQRTLDHIRGLRAAGCNNPVLVMRGERNAWETAAALDAGADDDIITPISGVEIRSRISSIARRSSGQVTESITIGEVTAFFDGRNPEISGRTVKLSPREHTIFQYLFVNSPKVMSRIAVYDAVYSLADSQPFDKVIDVYVCKIRKKISAAASSKHHYIETVFGRGYKFSSLEETFPILPSRQAAVAIF